MSDGKLSDFLKTKFGYIRCVKGPKNHLTGVGDARNLPYDSCRLYSFFSARHLCRTTDPVPVARYATAPSRTSIEPLSSSRSEKYFLPRYRSLECENGRIHCGKQLTNSGANYFSVIRRAGTARLYAARKLRVLRRRVGAGECFPGSECTKDGSAARQGDRINLN
jgi:hypothetical protein